MSKRLVTLSSNRCDSVSSPGLDLQRGYNHRRMDVVVRLIAKVVVPLFFLGMAGSAIVIAISFIEDLKELLEDDED